MEYKNNKTFFSGEKTWKRRPECYKNLHLKECIVYNVMAFMPVVLLTTVSVLLGLKDQTGIALAMVIGLFAMFLWLKTWRFLAIRTC